MSRLSLATDAVRPALKARLMLSGPPGAGKTRTGLIMATELAQGAPIIGIDTENNEMLTYADDFDFKHLGWAPPYDPRELADHIREAEDDYGCILIDSLTHFWRAEGGTLDIANGKFTGWKDARPAQEELIEAIKHCKTHVIICVRSKIEHVQEKEGEKHVVRTLGMAAMQDDTLEYEVNIAVDITKDHTVTVSKTRTTVLPVGRAFRAGHANELAAIYRDWLAAGEPPATQEQVEKITGAFAGITDEVARKAAKAAFLATFGKPETLTASRFAEALSVAKRLVEEATAPDRASEGGLEPTPPTESAPGEVVEPPIANGAPTAPAVSEESPESLQKDLEIAIKGLPTARQQGCRDEIRKTFGDLSSASVEDLRGALELVAIEARNIVEPVHTENAASLPAATEKPLNTKQRQLVAYARGIGVDEAQLRALAGNLTGSLEPRPLSELSDDGCVQMQGLLARVELGEIVFETGNAGLIAKEVEHA